jgi:hypothetical protein
MYLTREQLNALPVSAKVQVEAVASSASRRSAPQSAASSVSSLPTSLPSLLPRVLPQSVHVVTFATHVKPSLKKLTSRCKKLGFIPHVIGLGTSWIGFGDRMKKYCAFISDMLKSSSELKGVKKSDSVGCSSDDLVILVDGYDIVPFGTSTEVIDSFKRYNVEVLISAEGNCVPYMLPGADPLSLYPPCPIGRPFLNAGGIVGKAAALASFLNDVIITTQLADDGDDQAALTQYYIKHVHRFNKMQIENGGVPLNCANFPVPCGTSKAINVCLDSYCHVFQCTEFDEDSLEPKPKMGPFGRYHNTKTNSYPVFLHLAGRPAMLNLQRVYQCHRLFGPREMLEIICKGIHEESGGDLLLEKLQGYAGKKGDEISKHVAVGIKVARRGGRSPDY